MEDQFKINLGYNYRHINQNIRVKHPGCNEEKKFAVSGVSAGIDGHIQLPLKQSLILSLTHHYSLE